MPRLHGYSERDMRTDTLVYVSVDPLDQPCCICGGEATRRLDSHRAISFVEATAPVFDVECYSVFCDLNIDAKINFLSDYPIEETSRAD